MSRLQCGFVNGVTSFGNHSGGSLLLFNGLVSRKKAILRAFLSGPLGDAVNLFG